MSQYDNEIYRGPPETSPTLGRDMLSRGAEFYVVKSPQTTAQQDEPATEETILRESKPTPKKKSRIGKAMKLLASCVTTVAVVATLATPAPPVEPEPELPLWPRIGPTTYDWISQNSVDCQVANGHDSYCLTAQQEGVYLMWDNGFYTYFEVNMVIPDEDIPIYLYFDTDPASIENKKTDTSNMYSEEDQPAFGTGQIQTTSGETLYVLGMMWGNEMEELPPVQQIVDHLDEYIQISDATPDGWDKLLIGDTMYSEINPRWSGTVGASDSNEYLWYKLETVYSLADADCSEDNLICQRRVNGIDWSFYYGDLRLLDGRLIGRVIWAVPGQEDIALGYDSIVGGNPLLYLEGFYADDVTAWVTEFYSDTNQEWAFDYFGNNDGSWEAEQYGCDPSATWPEILEAVVDTTIIKYMVSQIYLVEQRPENKPANNPTDAIEGPTVDATDDTIPTVTEPTEVFPRTDVIVLYEYEESGNTYKGTQTIHYNMYGEVIKTEWHDYEDDALCHYQSESVQDGYERRENRSYIDGVLTYHLSESAQGEQGLREEYCYDENGVPLNDSVEYMQNGEVIKAEQHEYEDGALCYYRFKSVQGENELDEARWYDENGALSQSIVNSVQDGYTVYEEVSYNENGHIEQRKVRDDQNGIYTEEWFTYYESGAVQAHWISYYQDGSASQMVEEYQEEYDEGGTVIDTDHAIYDPETGFWILEDFEGGYSTSYGASYGTTGEMWSVDTYGDGLFGTSFPMSNEHLYSGIYQETFSETGNLWNDVQINEDGSGKNIWYYPDGSLEQSVVTTIDEETNTWIQIVEYHPAPSDDFCYRTEERVRFDDGGNIVEYYSNQDGNVKEIQLDNVEQSELKYDEEGRLIECYHVGENYVAIITFEYDQFGRLDQVGGFTQWYE